MIIARSKEEYGIAAVDPFSLGHFLKGYVLHMIFYIFYIPLVTSLILIFFISVLWEIIENNNFLRDYVKFNKKKDSLVNSGSDITFTILGALIFFFVSLTNSFTIIMISLIVCLVSLIFFGYRIFYVLKSIIRYNHPQDSGDYRGDK